MRRLINQRPGRGGALLLSLLPFILVICAYLFYSHARLLQRLGPGPGGLEVHELAVVLGLVA